jgi:hypothetical protein
MLKLPKRLNKEIQYSEAVSVWLKGKPEWAKLIIQVLIWMGKNGEIDGESEGGGWVNWSVSSHAKLETLLKTIPHSIEWCAPEGYREEIFGALEALGVGFARPPVPHEKLHGDAREGYDE